MRSGQPLKATKRVITYTGKATARCGHTVKVFGPSREYVYTTEYVAQFESCPTCRAKGN